MQAGATAQAPSAARGERQRVGLSEGALEEVRLTALLWVVAPVMCLL